MTYPHILNKNIVKFQSWLHDIEDYVGEDDNPSRALTALKATIHEIRDHLPIDLTAHLSDQLPIIIRGLFFEGWDPHKTSTKDRKLENFLDTIYHQVSPNYPSINIEKYILAVFYTLSLQVSEGIIYKILQVLPHSIKVFLNQEIKTQLPI